MKNIIFIIFLCTMLFSCKTTSIEDEQINEPKTESITPEIPVVDSEKPLIGDIVAEDNTANPLELDRPEVDTSLEDTQITVDSIDSTEDEIAFFENDNAVPILIDESEVVLSDDFETILIDDTSDDEALFDEEGNEQEIFLEEEGLLAPIEIEDDILVVDSLLNNEFAEPDALVLPDTDLLSDIEGTIDSDLAESLPLIPLTEALVADTTQLEGAMPEVETNIVDITEDHEFSDFLFEPETVAADTVSADQTILDTPIDTEFDEASTEEQEFPLISDNTTTSLPIEDSTIIGETSEPEMGTVVIPSMQEGSDLLSVPTSEMQADGSIVFENAIVPAQDTEDGPDSVTVPSTSEVAQDTVIVDISGSMVDIVPPMTSNASSQMNADDLIATEEGGAILENTELPLIEEFVAPIEVSQKLELFEEDYIDVYLSGHGWIYLGEVEESDPTILDFYARYIDGADTLFNFYAENAGTTILHFYKQDILANAYLDEYIEVTVKPIKAVTVAPKRSETQTEAMYGISAEPEVSLIGGRSETIDLDDSGYQFVPEDILDQAEEAFNEERFEDSIALLDEYTSLGVDEIDRALFLYGKNYESNSDVKNVRLSAASYEKIVDSFPDSVYWDEATKRLIYLERFYINIR